MRVLAVADRSWDAPAVERAAVGDGFRLLGLVGMIDPPRPEAMAAVAACRAAGIAVKMITGDHRATAQAIGEQLGLGGGLALGGTDLEALSADDLRQATRRTSVFARVAPEHKLRLVRALQQEGHVVAMTGDGVNDAPALKQADIGVAMGITGTSVSKEAADMVLADDNFASIVAAVEEGRRVYDNLVKSLAFVLPTNIGLALVLTWAVLFVPFDPSTGELLLPVLPTQLLWINLAAAVTLALPLAFEVLEPDAMARPPRDPREPILSPLVLRRTVLAAVLMTAAAVGVFRWEYTAALAAGEPARLALSEAQTITVTAIIAFQTFYMLQCRSLRSSLWRVGFASNPVVFAGVAAAVALQAAFVYAPPVNRIFGTAPLGPRDLLVAIAAGAVVLPVIGLEKWWTGRRSARPAA
jgi:Ca2+-transporting ATPase